MNKISILSLIALTFLSNILSGQNANYSVFKTSNGGNSSWIAHQNNNQELYRTIVGEALKLLEVRSKKIEHLKSVDDWDTYNKNLYANFFAGMEKFEKTPLNAKITGTIDRGNFRVEKILFESQPNFFVTACLFIPAIRQNPAPTVIYVSGHTELGFRSPTYQNVILNLVEKGFIVFAIDPIGQGERLQYVNPETNLSEIGGPTTEHSYAGAQTLLTGSSLSDYFIWDGVRAIDYLATRKEVDMERIGFTGRSGGGTQTALIAAYDSRVYAAAPECYITNFKRLLQSIGPQDAEQNPYRAIKLGFDFPDYFHLRAPKPSLIITTSNDFFSQQGARETFAEAKKSYDALGYPGNISKIEDFGVHESTKNNREAMYAFFQKYLNNPGDSSDIPTTIFAAEELWVTETGQIGTSIKGATVFDLNEKFFAKKEVPKSNLKEWVKNLSGITFDRKLATTVFTGKVMGDGFEIDKYFLESNIADFVLPVWVVNAPKTKSNKIMVWLNPGGKKEILKSELFFSFINSGYTIIAADLPGTGELFNPGFKGDGYVKKVPFNYTFGAHLVGKSITGFKAEALDLLMQFVAEKNNENFKTNAFVEGEMSAPFLHFTTFEQPFSKVLFQSPLTSNESLIHEKFYDPRLAYSVVPGSVAYYDFKDLVSFLPKNSYKVMNPVNASGEAGSGQFDAKAILEFYGE